MLNFVLENLRIEKNWKEGVGRVPEVLREGKKYEDHKKYWKKENSVARGHKILENVWKQLGSKYWERAKNVGRHVLGEKKKSLDKAKKDTERG